MALGVSVGGRGPQRGVDREPGGAHRGHGRVDRGAAVVLVAGPGRQVVDEAAGDALAELGVVGGVQDERVPALVDLGGRGQARCGVRAQV